MKEKQAGKLLLVSLISAAAGAGAALLVAPRSGKETRAQLKAKGRELKKQVQKGMDSARHTVEEGVKRGKDIAESVTEGISTAAEDVETETGNKLGKVKSSLAKNWEEEY